MSQKEFQRQVQRLKRRYRPDSLGWVQHGNRGRPMPWALPLPQKQLNIRASTIRIWRKNYVPKRTSLSAARPCAAFYAARNSPLPRNRTKLSRHVVRKTVP